jgi:hypothetical protein
MVWLVDIDPQLDGLPIHPQKGHHWSAPPLHPKGRKGLDMQSFMKKGDGKNLGCHHRSLPSSSMKSDFDHHWPRKNV